MIVCVCRAVTVKEIEDAVQQGKFSLLMSEKAPGSVCGSCIPEIREIIQDAQISEQSEVDD